MRKHKQPPLKHYLLSVVIAHDMHMHCYLMSRDKGDALEAATWLVNEAEKAGSRHPLRTTILATPLEHDTQRVREILIEGHDEVKRALREATDFHYAIFVTHDSDPIDAELMAMH